MLYQYRTPSISFIRSFSFIRSASPFPSFSFCLSRSRSCSQSLIFLRVFFAPLLLTTYFIWTSLTCYFQNYWILKMFYALNRLQTVCISLLKVNKILSRIKFSTVCKIKSVPNGFAKYIVYKLFWHTHTQLNGWVPPMKMYVNNFSLWQMREFLTPYSRADTHNFYFN